MPNAGVQHVAPVKEFPEDKWELLISLMLTSPFLLARYAWEALERGEQARYIAIASAHALAASPYKSAYVSAKHGVLGLVRTLALEGAEAGISATAVCPGYVRTPLVEGQIPDQAKAHGISEEEALEEVILAPHAIKRLIEPDEVAGVVAFLASEARRVVHGRARDDGPGLDRPLTAGAGERQRRLGRGAREPPAAATPNASGRLFRLSLNNHTASMQIGAAGALPHLPHPEPLTSACAPPPGESRK